MKKYLTSSFYYLAIGFLPLASNFLLTPFFTRYLYPEEYGILALAALFQAYLTIFLSVGIDSAFSRLFYKFYRKPRLLNAFFSTVLCCIAAISAFYSLIFWFAGNSIIDFVFSNSEFTFSKYGNIVLATTIVSLLHSVALSYYRNLENIKGFAVLAVSFFVLMTIGAVIGVMVLELGAWGSLAGKLAGSVVVVMAFLVYFFTRHKVTFKAKFLPPVFKFGLPIIPYLLLGITLDNLDRFLIERYLSLSELGKYNIAFLIASVTAVVLQSVTSAVNPSVFRLMESRKPENRNQTDKEINLLFTGLNLFILVFIALLTMLAQPLAMFLIDQKYHSMLQYLPLLFLAYIPRVFFVIYSIPLFFYNKTKLLPLINVIALVIGGLIMYGFLSAIGIFGICLGVIAVKFLQTIAAVYFLKKERYFEPALFKLQKNIVLSVVLAAGIFAAVWASLYFPDKRAHLYFVAGAAGIATIAIFYLPEIKQLKSKFF